MARGGKNTNLISYNSSTSNVVSSSSSMEDSASPYYLQNGDYPGLILVTHSLNGPNFNSRSREMIIALTARNKVCFVDGSLLRPHNSDLFFAAWTRCNSMVISWLLNFVSKEIADSLMYFSTAYDLWDDLRVRFHQANEPHIFQLKQQISSLHQGSLDVNTYYTKLKIIWDELKDYSPNLACTCGVLRILSTTQQQDYAMQLLMGLNDSFL
ncbi:uncharacterized protein LOC133316130 [Gastrolobium bilobum]|uniref:uncharacterized protein LOC133316130 n=1 Tax=Gastrolobium bilobum TaxID=150636 RepID=UPI002AB2D84E|nr:uncharacterized protein LOC133316130 [Gastrolobium bilobum]